MKLRCLILILLFPLYIEHMINIAYQSIQIIKLSCYLSPILSWKEEMKIEFNFLSNKVMYIYELLWWIKAELF